VGLNGSGDKRQTVFSTQMLANILQRLGMQVPASSVRVSNVAAVFVTANLPAFARPGTAIDVTVSSIGDAKSLDGGLLLLTPLYASNGEAYAQAQGSVVLGGYSAGGTGNSRQMNHPTVGRIVNGGTVERPNPVDLQQMRVVSLLLREADFGVTHDVAAVINQSLGTAVARAVDSRRIEVEVASSGVANVPELMARIEDLRVIIHPPAKVVVNERTGTVVMGGDVRLSAVSVLHAGLVIEISTQFAVSQPGPISQGTTAVVPETTIRTQDAPARRIELKDGSTVDDLVRGLQNIGASARDIIAILQAIKTSGGLTAELEVI
jgi:flagellar P-ring protein precursor FlgI